MIAVISGTGPARSGVILMARILADDGEPICEADLSSITYFVTDLTLGTSDTSATALTVADVIYDDLQQNDPRWRKDSEQKPGPDGRWGYNFLTTIPRTKFLVATASTTTPSPKKYQIDITFVPNSGQSFVQPFIFTAVPVYV